MRNENISREQGRLPSIKDGVITDQTVMTSQRKREPRPVQNATRVDFPTSQYTSANTASVNETLKYPLTFSKGTTKLHLCGLNSQIDRATCRSWNLRYVYNWLEYNNSPKIVIKSGSSRTHQKRCQSDRITSQAHRKGTTRTDRQIKKD